jgi:hypothetical protein
MKQAQEVHTLQRPEVPAKLLVSDKASKSKIFQKVRQCIYCLRQSLPSALISFDRDQRASVIDLNMPRSDSGLRRNVGHRSCGQTQFRKPAASHSTSPGSLTISSATPLNVAGSPPNSTFLDILAGFFADRNWTADDPAGLEDFPVGSTKFPCLRNFNSLIPHSKRAR